MPRPSVLDRFTAPTRRWFTGAFTKPTAAQKGAWTSIADGANTLVIAPTGSGKTLAAFLWALDRLAAETGSRTPGTKVVYISPLKALAVDVERNLRAPLTGITRAAQELDLPEPNITVGVRSGDTSAADRRALVKTPPDILITTPESLYLMLTSAARESLTGVEAIIIDEVHAVAATKRGTHLALTLERLDELLDKPAQRIGLSATVRPPEVVAGFLSGAAPCQVVKPKADKTFDLRVDVPVEDMANIPAPPSDADPAALDDAFSPTAGSLWPYVEASIVDQIEANRATIVFANSRRLAEKLTARLNEIHAERSGSPAEPTANPTVAGGAPAFVMGSGASSGAEPLLARAHHGSVSKEQRAQIEDDLKAGRLACVVATSSLELGIDMGAVDLVIQVEAPPSVASGLQRIGRAGHQVGEISQGILYPKHRTDLLHCTVTVGRMLDGAIEETRVPQNPLDILAQQTIAAAAIDDLDVDHWYEVVRRAAPYRELGRGVFDATLDLIAGRFPSDEFAELRPRVNWDRDAGVITGRRGAQRLAVTSGGSIPDRGLFGVFMVGEKSTRVGELDEEMVYESRVGDVFALGATSWRIEDITHDRVLVSPAFGQPGRLPFWIGDAIGRPAELGAAIGAFTGTIADPGKLDDHAERLGLTENARTNLAALIAEQREATGHLPTDRTLVVERFRDELGDWRVILHSPYGLRVHAPWASAISQRLMETLGLEGATTASDDGIILRLPDTDDTPPGAEKFLLDPDDVEQLVTDGLADSSMFASRFRECASRALLLPRRDPGRRAPLWQQRQRSAQLLSVASKFPDFPIVLEAVRECLQDVYDLPALLDLLTRIRARRIRVVETETPSPSPFAASLLFGYVGAFMYADDAPLAERRAAALSLDTSLLAQLLGRVDLRELLDPAVIADVIARLQRLAPERRARDAEDVVDVLRWLGPLDTDEVAARYCGADPVDGVLSELHRSGQIISVNHNRRALWASIDDTARLRDALGVPAPLGIPAACLEPVPDPVGDLIGRYARTHGPFTVPDASAALGIPTGVVRDTLTRLAAERRVIEGDFLPEAPPADSPVGAVQAQQTSQWCHTDVLGQIRRGSLAASRAEVAPVGTEVLTRFLLDWQHASPGTQLRGADGVATVIDQLAGYPLPASAWESLVLPARVSDYAPAMLDELLSTGEVLWSGHGRIGSSDGWVALHPADVAALTLPDPDEIDTTTVHDAITAALTPGGALRFPQIAATIYGSEASPPTTTPAADTETALWDLVWAGQVSNDTFAPLRALLHPRRTPSSPRSAPAHRARGRAPRLRAGRLSARYLTDHATSPPVSPTASGRWFALDHPSTGPTVATQALCDQLLTRYGLITRGSVTAEEVTGGFARVYKALTVFEDNGHVRRGYYVDGLGGAQFASPATVDELRRHALPDRKPPREATVLAATDPANPFGAALEWPRSRDADAGHRPGRKPGALVVLVDGELVCFVERGGKTLLTFTESIPGLESAAGALVALVRAGRISRLTIDHIDSEPVRATDFGKVLVEAGFSTTPRGIRLRFGAHA
ncbi:ATP-dependent helicase [Gordonia jinghuaiqii]|uniref:ATP-dependent helicase n=1 Tax=Gordonia jinghuaiqii TaxID=2758710 RepID=A0A7D7R518_9ACTN|nr:ATP-dependent helicase [Gordonia jinghuaiqii]MCR5979975.1 ATP-dependent helicase [Gordonia jinghuaiqii]QMT03172.1 ATP-dependent helicase [Gordonia jinghuaiqii]